MNKLVRTTNIISIILFKSVMNVLKHGLFNLFMLTLGFCLGYYALAMKVHYYATVHDSYDYIEKIETHVKLLEEMDNEYAKKQLELLDVLKLYKLKISHDIHHECDSTVGTVLYK